MQDSPNVICVPPYTPLRSEDEKFLSWGEGQFPPRGDDTFVFPSYDNSGLDTSLFEQDVPEVFNRLSSFVKNSPSCSVNLSQVFLGGDE